MIDTPGAYPGIGAEERGQAEAIAYNLKEICKLTVPVVVVIHGEGGKRRRAGYRGGRRSADVREFDLLGDLSRELFLDSLA